MTNYVDLDSLSAITLRHLAALREEFDRTRDQARYVDYRAMAEELAMMLYEGRTPTIGWYRRRLRPVEPGVPVELGILVEWGKNGIPETPLPAALGSNRMGSDNGHASLRWSVARPNHTRSPAVAAEDPVRGGTEKGPTKSIQLPCTWLPDRLIL